MSDKKCPTCGGDEFDARPGNPKRCCNCGWTSDDKCPICGSGLSNAEFGGVPLFACGRRADGRGYAPGGNSRCEIVRLRAVVDSYGLTTADGVTVKCTDTVYGPSAIDGDDTIHEIFVGGPHLYVVEDAQSTGEEWDLIENCYSTEAAAREAAEGRR